MYSIMRNIHRSDLHIAYLLYTIYIQRADFFSVIHVFSQTPACLLTSVNIPAGILLRKNLQPFYMIAVLVGDKDARDIAPVRPRLLQSRMYFFRADACIYEYCRLSAFIR